MKINKVKVSRIPNRPYKNNQEVFNRAALFLCNQGEQCLSSNGSETCQNINKKGHRCAAACLLNKKLLKQKQETIDEIMEYEDDKKTDEIREKLKNIDKTFIYMLRCRLHDGYHPDDFYENLLSGCEYIANLYNLENPLKGIKI